VMARISDWTRPGASSLRRRMDGAEVEEAGIVKRAYRSAPFHPTQIGPAWQRAELNHVQQPQDDDDQQNCPQAARWIVAPAARVRISREGRKHQYQQNDDDDEQVVPPIWSLITLCGR